MQHFHIVKASVCSTHPLVPSHNRTSEREDDGIMMIFPGRDGEPTEPLSIISREEGRTDCMYGNEEIGDKWWRNSAERKKCKEDPPAIKNYCFPSKQSLGPLILFLFNPVKSRQNEWNRSRWGESEICTRSRRRLAVWEVENLEFWGKTGSLGRSSRGAVVPLRISIFLFLDSVQGLSRPAARWINRSTEEEKKETKRA